MDFILSINPDILSDTQIDALIDIIDKIEQAGQDDIEETTKRAKKSLSTIKSYSRSWYRKNKISITGRKKKIERSAKKRKEMRAKDRMAAGNKTPSGRKKILYNTQGHSNK